MFYHLMRGQRLSTNIRDVWSHRRSGSVYGGLQITTVVRRSSRRCSQTTHAKRVTHTTAGSFIKRDPAILWMRHGPLKRRWVPTLCFISQVFVRAENWQQNNSFCLNVMKRILRLGCFQIKIPKHQLRRVELWIEKRCQHSAPKRLWKITCRLAWPSEYTSLLDDILFVTITQCVFLNEQSQMWKGYNAVHLPKCDYVSRSNCLSSDDISHCSVWAL